MVNWKAIAVFAGAGFVLSLLAGMLSGNPFGVILLRMLLSTVGSAGLGFGLLFLVDRFLPEMGPKGTTAHDGGGEHVDIVVPGENPHAAEPGFSEEPEALAPGEAGSSSPGTRMTTGDVDQGEVSEAEEVGGIDELAAEATSLEPALEVAEDGAVGEPEGEPQPQGSGPAYGLDSLSGRGGTVAAGGQQHEPEVVARALRTMMKRDDQG